MVSIPVRLHKAARRERIRFHHVYQPAEGRIPPDADPEDKTATIEDEPEEPRIAATHQPSRAEDVRSEDIPPEHVERVHNAPGPAGIPILKGYELQKDQYVVLEPRELAALRPRTSTELGILEFVLLEEIDPVGWSAA